MKFLNKMLLIMFVLYAIPRLAYGDDAQINELRNRVEYLEKKVETMNQTLTKIMAILDSSSVQRSQQSINLGPLDESLSVGGGQGDFRFLWDQPEAGKARRLLSSSQPRIPEWVSKEGLSLTVLVSFTLTPDGLLSDVNVEASSGYNDVDEAVSEAVRLWRFSADPSARPIHGQIPYAVRAR